MKKEQDFWSKVLAVVTAAFVIGCFMQTLQVRDRLTRLETRLDFVTAHIAAVDPVAHVSPLADVSRPVTPETLRGAQALMQK